MTNATILMLAALAIWRVVVSVFVFIVIPVSMFAVGCLILRSIRRSGDRIEAKMAAAHSMSEEGFRQVRTAIEALPDHLASRTFRMEQRQAAAPEPPQAA